MKKAVSYFMALTLAAAALTGCGSTGTTETAGDTAQSEAAGDNQAAEGEAAGDDSAAAGAETFLIGGTGPLTGDNALYGNAVKNGAQIAIDEINAAGGVDVNGTKYQFALDFQDDVADGETAIAAYNKLMDNGINAFLGTVTSGACIAVSDATYADGILQLTPSGSQLECTQYDNAFRVCFADPLQGEVMAKYAVETLGKQKAAVIYHNDSDYSAGMADVFKETVENLGGEVVAYEASGSSDVDFATQLTKIKGTDAEIIFVPTYYGAATYIAQQAADLGMEIPFIGGDGWDGILDNVTDASIVEGAVFLSPFFAEDPAAADFVAAYKAAFNETPIQFAADGYDGVYIIKAAMEKAGSIESSDIIAAMTEIEVDGLTGKMTFTPEGEPEKDAKLIAIENGKYTLK